MAGKAIDMMGFETENARVTARAENRGHQASWQLECVCGATFEAASNEIRRRPRMTCGKGHEDRMMIGKTYGKLYVFAIDSQAPGYVIADCECGYYSVSVNAGSLRNGQRRSCGCANLEQASAMGAVTNKGKTGAEHPSYGIKKEEHHNWKGDTVSYSGAHSRLKAWFGPARNYACFNCGKPALDWAFKNVCPDARMQVGGVGDGYMYCPHTECYVTACRQCHAILIDGNNAKILTLSGHTVLAFPGEYKEAA